MKRFELMLRLKGFPISEAKAELARVGNLTTDDFQSYTMKMKDEIFSFHLKHNKYYGNFIGTKSINEWTDIPVLTKQSIQLKPAERLSDGYKIEDVYLNNTSGSSGHPFFFAKDKFAHAMTWALIFDRYQRHGIDLNNSLQARFFGIPFTRKGYLKEKVKDAVSKRVRFPVFDLSDNVLEGYLKIFAEKKFIYLNGYTSSLALFAKYVEKKGRTLKEVCPSLRRCITTSEVCTPEDRQLMERAFGVKVVNEYGAAELDLIAFEDQDFDWIMTNENLFFEVVDDENKPVQAGNEGKLLVTSLYNKAMPFIRYELGDIVKISNRKKGNNWILESLTGRTNDVAVLPSGKKSPGLTFYYISKSLLEEGGFLKEFIIKQTGPAHFIYEYISERELTDEQIKKVRQMIDLYLEPGLESEFVRVDHIDRTKAGKLKHFQKTY